MRTGRSMTVCCSVLPGGGLLGPGGGSAWSGGEVLHPGGSAWSGGGSPWSRGGLHPGGVWHPSMHWGRHPPPPVAPCGQTDTCKKYYLGHNFVAAGKNYTWDKLPKCLAQALCCFAQGGYCGLNLTTNIISSKTRLNVKYVAHDGTAEQT